LTIESPIPLKDACRLVPPARRGLRCHLSTLVRWITVGCRGPSGERVKLEALRIGGRWVTSREALQRLAERLTPHLGGDTPASPHRTAGQQRRANERAGRKLEKKGI
jgi:hypothetical protein